MGYHSLDVPRVIQAPPQIQTQVTAGHSSGSNVTAPKPKLGYTERLQPSESTQDFGVSQGWFVQIPAPQLLASYLQPETYQLMGFSCFAVLPAD